jgi:ABC-2 type transport system ATP-binding protein
MKEFQRQYEEVQDYLRFGDYNLVIKRLIDFTLDTQSKVFYNRTVGLLDWLDANEGSAEIPGKLSEVLNDLHAFLVQLPSREPKTVIEVHGVQKLYSRSSFSLGPVSLSLKEGDIIGLVGENGNGKTTLLRLLCGELYPTGGSISYNFQHRDRYDLRTQLIYIPQRTDTWRGPMFENLLFTAASYGYPPDEIHAIAELTIARLGLRKFRKHGWKDLSSGYKMRFELARMLLRKPKVLLIDEPLANLDIIAQQTVLEDFRSIAKSVFRPIGIVLSSQQLYEVEKTSDQVIFLKHGVQKNLYGQDQTETGNQLVVEFESPWTQRELNEALADADLSTLQFNGGTYIATFNAGQTVAGFMHCAVGKGIPIVYFRDISNSTRRFFVS